MRPEGCRSSRKEFAEGNLESLEETGRRFHGQRDAQWIKKRGDQVLHISYSLRVPFKSDELYT